MSLSAYDSDKKIDRELDAISFQIISQSPDKLWQVLEKLKFIEYNQGAIHQSSIIKKAVEEKCKTTGGRDQARDYS